MSYFRQSVLDRLPHHTREPDGANGLGRDPKTPGRRVAVKFRSINGELQRKMGEDLFNFARQPPPERDDRSDFGRRASRAASWSTACPAAR